jgi:hypothetical protein
MPSCFKISISRAQLAERNPIAARVQRFAFFRSFFVDGDSGNVVPQSARAFEGSSGKITPRKSWKLYHSWGGRAG